MDFLTEPLRYAVVNASLNDIIAKIWMRKGDDHFYDCFLVELFLPFGSFSFNPLSFPFFLFKPGIIVFVVVKVQIFYLPFKVGQHLMFRPCGVKLLDQVNDITAVLVVATKVTPEVLRCIDGERGRSFRTERRAEEVITPFADSFTIVVKTHPLEDADRFNFVYSHVLL